MITFCERPGYVVVEDERRLADFWVRFYDRQELVILSDVSAENAPAGSRHDLDAAALPIRTVASAEIAAAQAWIENWQRMLPYIVANRDLISAALSRAIERFLAYPHKLLEVEREFATGDPVLMRAALFGLLHAGKASRRICARSRCRCSRPFWSKGHIHELRQTRIAGDRHHDLADRRLHGVR
ncbi:hypothetical protein [Paraburkholderia sp. Cy-641]|uniref:hypothetical protein n=1 Tax=Paraburkholderia sp. Cy-641 TaxID=2608337 RepID=UPI0031F4C39F